MATAIAATGTAVIIIAVIATTATGIVETGMVVTTIVDTITVAAEIVVIGTAGTVIVATLIVALAIVATAIAAITIADTVTVVIGIVVTGIRLHFQVVALTRKIKKSSYSIKYLIGLLMIGISQKQEKSCFIVRMKKTVKTGGIIYQR